MSSFPSFSPLSINHPHAKYSVVQPKDCQLPFLLVMRCLNICCSEISVSFAYSRDIIARGTLAILEYLRTRLDSDPDLRPSVSDAAVAVKYKGCIDLSSKSMPRLYICASNGVQAWSFGMSDLSVPHV